MGNVVAGTNQSVSTEGKRFRWLGRVVRFSVWCILLITTVWAVAALYFDVRISWLRVPLAAIYGLAMLIAGFKLPRRRAMIIAIAGFVVVLVWWLSLRPSNFRDWQPDVAILSWAEIEGNRASIRNIRNCDYRTETDYDVHHYDKTFDLQKLRTVDLFLFYWGSPNIAHTMMSFGFEGDEYICFSIETRKEKGEGYSAVRGFFRQYELMYVVSDERDVVRLRTNYRKGENGYLYRLRTTPDQGRALLMAYLRRTNALRDRPEWYNALTDNCTTAIRTQRAASDRMPWDWRLLANGHADELLYERGLIETNLPFNELKARSLINSRAKAADNAADFSRRIRAGLPIAHEPPNKINVSPAQPPV